MTMTRVFNILELVKGILFYYEMFVKYVFFTLHTLLIMVCLADIYKYQVVTLLQYIAILSWHFNNNILCYHTARRLLFQ